MPGCNPLRILVSIDVPDPPGSFGLFSPDGFLI